MKWIRWVLLKIQSIHESILSTNGQTDKVKPVYPAFNFIEAGGGGNMKIWGLKSRRPGKGESVQAEATHHPHTKTTCHHHHHPPNLHLPQPTRTIIHSSSPPEVLVLGMFCKQKWPKVSTNTTRVAINDNIKIRPLQLSKFVGNTARSLPAISQLRSVFPPLVEPWCCGICNG